MYIIKEEEFEQKLEAEMFTNKDDLAFLNKSVSQYVQNKAGKGFGGIGKWIRKEQTTVHMSQTMANEVFQITSENRTNVITVHDIHVMTMAQNVLVQRKMPI